MVAGVPHSLMPFRRRPRGFSDRTGGRLSRGRASAGRTRGRSRDRSGEGALDRPVRHERTAIGPLACARAACAWIRQPDRTGDHVRDRGDRRSAARLTAGSGRRLLAAAVQKGRDGCSGWRTVGAEGAVGACLLTTAGLAGRTGRPRARDLGDSAARGTGGVERDHRRRRRRGRLRDADRRRRAAGAWPGSGANRGHGDPAARPGRRGQVLPGRLVLAQRQRRDDRHRLAGRGRRAVAAGRHHQHARDRPGARRDHRLVDRASSRRWRPGGTCRSWPRPGTATSTTSTAGTSPR